MSVTIATSSPAQATWWQRLTGTEPKTIVTETTRTQIVNDSGGSFDIKDAIRNGGIGAALAGALGGVSLLGKVALPLIGRVGSVAGLVKLAGVGGAIGVATAAIPLVAPKVRDNPTAKAALLGASIGAGAGAILPLIPIPIGAAIGAGVALLIKYRKDHPRPQYNQYFGYRSYPGYVPAGTSSGDSIPSGFVPVTPNYGMYSQSAVSPFTAGLSGYPTSAYGMQGAYAPTGYGFGYGPSSGMYLPATSGQTTPNTPQSTRPTVAAKPAKRPVRTKAKTFTDRSGNLRQVGTGKILKYGARTAASVGVGTVPAGTPAPVGAGMPARVGTGAPALFGTGMPVSVGAGLPAAAGINDLSMLMRTVPQAMSGANAAAISTPVVASSMQPSIIPARPTA